MGLLERVAASGSASRSAVARGSPSRRSGLSTGCGTAAGCPACTPDRERIENDFEGYVEGAYKADGIVFACILARQLAFSEARFQWRQLRSGRPGDLFGNPTSRCSRSRGRAAPPATC